MKKPLFIPMVTILVLFLVNGRPVWSANYYVDPSSPHSTDSGNGTNSAPFKTISAAANAAIAGDTVIVRPGLYREDVELRNSGTAEKPIVFVADPEGKAMITGADKLTAWTRVPGSAAVYSAPWSHVFAIDWVNGKPIEYHPASAPLWGRAEQVMCDGDQLKPVDGLGSLSSSQISLDDPVPTLGPKFSGWFAVDTSAKAIYVRLGDDSDPNSHELLASTRAEIFGTNQWSFPPGIQHVKVRGFVFRYGASFPQRAAVNLYGKDNELTDCVVERMSGCGVSVSGTMESCVIRDCGQIGGGPQGDGFNAKNCIWVDNDWKPIDRGWDAGGEKIVMAGGGSWESCCFEHNGGPGLWFDIDLHGAHITKCVFEDNESAGVFNEISRQNRFDHNLFLRNGVLSGVDPGWNAGGLTFGESEDCSATNNTMVGNRNGISIREQGPRPTTSADGRTISYHNKGLKFTNNVCADNCDSQLQLAWDNCFFGRHPAEYKKYPTDAEYQEFLKTIPNLVFDPAGQDLVFDNNIYFANNKQKLIAYGVGWREKSKQYDSLSEWTAVNGWDGHSQSAVPGFVDASKDDYRFKRGSAAQKLGAGWLEAPANIDVWKHSLVPKWEQSEVKE